MIRNHETRSGFTLTEVLMAMFVMAIGMISLLALFPVAFQQARWALDNEQVARSAANAQSTSELPRVAVDSTTGMVSTNAQSIRNDDRYRPDASNPFLLWRCPSTGPLGRPQFLFDTTANTWTFSTDVNIPLPGTKVKFPPVFVDPNIATFTGFIEVATNLPFHVGAVATRLPFSSIPGFAGDPATLRPNISVGIPRSSLSQYSRDPGGLGLTQRMQTETSMGDEVTFGSNGLPELNTAGEVNRQRRFSWAYMCNWPDYNTPEVCEVTAVLFNTRPDNGGLATLPPGELTYGSNVAVGAFSGTDTVGYGRVFVKGQIQVSVALGNTTPAPMEIKAGDWILDSTMILPDYNPAFPTEKAPFLDTYNPLPAAAYNFPLAGPFTRVLRPGLVGGQFYKVMDISVVKRATSGDYYQTITLDRPAKSDGFSLTTFKGIADVITKGVGRMPAH